MEVLLIDSDSNHWGGIEQIKSAVANVGTNVEVHHSPSFNSALMHLTKKSWQRSIIFLEDSFHSATVDFLRNLRRRGLLTTTILLSTAKISDYELDNYNELGVECIMDKRIFKKRLQQTLKVIVSSVVGTNRD